MKEPFEYDYLILCDESGELGYSDREKSSNGFCVVSMVAIHKCILKDFLNDLRFLLEKFNSDDTYKNKLHIREVEHNKKEAVREDIFNLIRKYEVPIFYHAVKNKMFFDDFNNQKINFDNASLIHKSQPIKKVTLSENNLNQFKKLSQAEAFYIAYLNFCTTLITMTNSNYTATIKTDNVDQKILDEYKRKIELVHGKERKPLTINGFNHEIKRRINTSISAKTSYQHPLDNYRFESSADIEVDTYQITIVADIITNSIRHYLEKHIKNNGFELSLNIENSIKEHPLLDYIMVRDNNTKIFPWTH